MAANTNTTTKHTPAQLEALALDAERNAERFADYTGMRDTFTHFAITWWRQLAHDTKCAEQRRYANAQIEALEAWLKQ